MKGVDYAWTHPSPAALKAAGIAFVMRYLSTDASKNLTRAEANALAEENIWCGVVWESTANRAGAGKAAGQADAKTALAQATAAGMPAGHPVYLAVDYDADPATVVPYFQGAASVLGLDRTGVYGGYKVVKYLLDHELVTFAWQTAAWSAGKWDARAHIRQGAYIKIGGVQCDANTSQKDDFGQWMPGKTPEEDVALSDADKTWLTNAIKAQSFTGVWATDAIKAPADAPDIKTNPTWQAQSILTDIQAHVRAAAPAALTDAQVAALGQQLATSATFATAVAEQVADLIAQRLQS